MNEGLRGWGLTSTQQKKNIAGDSVRKMRREEDVNI
jgi:hypothetical protein